MPDPDLLARAVKLGLKLATCAYCQDHKTCDCGHCYHLHAAMQDNPAPCPMCLGGGEDRTPWAIFGAVALAWTGKSGVKVHGDRVELFDWPSGGRWAPHDGTPEGIRDAALTAFCRARETRDA